MNASFTLNIPNTNVGLGALNTLPDEVKRFKANNPLIITDKGIVASGLVKNLTELLSQEGINFFVFDELTAEPSTNKVDEIGGIVRRENHDLLIGFGGGTAIDITKAVSVTAFSDNKIDFIMQNPVYPNLSGPFLPKVFIPTTAGTGSEWSNVVVLFQYTPEEREVVAFSWDFMGDKVIIDPELTKGLPPRITADTGFDALCHAMEAYINPSANAYTDLLATKAIETVGMFLRRAVSDGKDMEARYHMSFAAAFAMNACGTGGAGLPHLINEIIVPFTNASHGTALAVVTPAVMKFNLKAVQARYAHIAQLLGEDISGVSEAEAAAKAPEAVQKLISDINIPSRMSEIGIKESDISSLAKKFKEINGAVVPMVNPCDTSIEEIEAIFKRAL